MPKRLDDIRWVLRRLIWIRPVPMRLMWVSAEKTHPDVVGT